MYGCKSQGVSENIYSGGKIGVESLFLTFRLVEKICDKYWASFY